jgi:putative membrane protein
MFTNIRTMTALALVLTFGGSVGYAQTTVTTGADTPPISDASFVEQATAAGKAEVESGKLAAQKATNPDVKAFAEAMVRDHEKANADLTKIAGERGFPARGSKGGTPLSAEEGSAQQSSRTLANLSGQEFDREYMVTQVKDHTEAVKLYEAQAAVSKDEQLRAFATAQLPALKQHLERAQAIADPLVNNETASGATGTPKR